MSEKTYYVAYSNSLNGEHGVIIPFENKEGFIVKPMGTSAHMSLSEADALCSRLESEYGWIRHFYIMEDKLS